MALKVGSPCCVIGLVGLWVVDTAPMDNKARLGCWDSLMAYEHPMNIACKVG